MDQGQAMGHGKSTAGGLTARLAEVSAQLVGVGHGEAGAVDEPEAMAMPQAAALCGREHGAGADGEKFLQNSQRQPSARFAISLAGEAAIGQTRQMIASRITPEDLQQE